MKELLIEAPNGKRIKSTMRAYEIIYKPLYGYKIVEEVESIEPEINEEVDSKPKGRGRRPKLEVGE